MPLRSLNAYLSPSLLIVHDSARPATSCVLSSGSVTSVSTMRRPTRLELRSVTCAGSRFTGSATRPRTRVPAGCAATSAPDARSTTASTSHAIDILIVASSDLASRYTIARGRARHGSRIARRRPTMRYEVVEGWEQLPKGFEHRDVAGVAVDGEDRVFLICRSDHPIIASHDKAEFLRPCGQRQSTYRSHATAPAPDRTL